MKDVFISDSIVYVGVDDKNIIFLKVSMSFQTVFLTILM